ncbi:AraC family transcriptional regulator [Fulvitalea axinellae]|uniref:AraC family transcriptional regulator n=1 Tax=Fulvitalea axinellae TaxID=1182444 RepID=A0AAU9CV93_9BACT|nr:AraC family transcriptional regulator [Fulvitalea axinellae]
MSRMKRNAQESSISKFSTSEFREKFFEKGSERDHLYKGDPDRFLIAKFEEFKNIIKLPIPPYRREVSQFYLITDGEMTKMCNLNEVKVRKGQAHLWQQDQITSLLGFSKDVQGFYCHFSYDFLIQSQFTTNVTKQFERLNQFMHHHALTLNQDTFEAVSSILERMHQEYHGPHNAGKLRAYLVAMLFELNSALPEQIDISNFSRQEDLMNSFKSVIFKHISKEHSVKFYADKLHVSPNHLNKTVKQLTGETARDWLTKALVLGAKVLLKQTALSVNEIAFQLGYEDPSYFTRFFKKNTGMLPSEFRTMD